MEFRKSETLVILDCLPDTINIYDSLYSRISKHTTKQVCVLLHTQSDTITLLMYMQIQTGAADCGLFAIVTATVLCYGIPPTNTVWDQSKILIHILQCL